MLIDHCLLTYPMLIDSNFFLLGMGACANPRQLAAHVLGAARVKVNGDTLSACGGACAWYVSAERQHESRVRGVSDGYPTPGLGRSSKFYRKKLHDCALSTRRRKREAPLFSSTCGLARRLHQAFARFAKRPISQTATARRQTAAVSQGGHGNGSNDSNTGSRQWQHQQQ